MDPAPTDAVAAADKASSPIHIDGSFGEGGGQIIRNAVTLACLLKKHIQVIKIRHNRPNPGLASQHLESILAMLRITGATTSSTNLAKGVTEFDFDGRTVCMPQGSKLDTEIDLKTAGSITLCIQGILPYLLSLRIPSKIKIIGGTHVMKAPNLDYMDYVFVPIMKKFLKHDVDVRMIRPGYFPRGGGIVELELKPHELEQPKSQEFAPFNITQRGKLLSKFAILNLPPHLYNQSNQFIPRMKLIDPREELRLGRGHYATVEYFLTFENGYAGFFDMIPGLGRPPKPTPLDVTNSIEKVEKAARIFLECEEAAIDHFMQDQLIVYMTMSKIYNPDAVSKFTTMYPLEDHTTSAMHVAKLMTNLDFTVKVDEGGKYCEISL